MSVIEPLIFATIDLLHVQRRAASRRRSLYFALGAGMMGIWSSTLFGSGGAIQWQRWQGTLELLVAAPPPFLLVICPADARYGVDRALLAHRDAPVGAALLRRAVRPGAPVPFVVALPVD